MNKKIMVIVLSKKYMNIIILVIMSILNITQTDTYDNKTTEVELEKYLGKWYEIARYNHSFEKGMERVTAEYSQKPDGTIIVVNSGYRNGNLKVAKAKGKTTNISGLLRVSFFLNFYSDYRILEIDNDYRWALVGSSSPNYLWILSRTPELEAAEVAKILEKAQTRGYDIDNLIWVKQ